MRSTDVRNSVTRHILESPQALQSAIAIREHLESAVHEILNEFLNALYKKLESGLTTLPTKETFRWSMDRYYALWPKDKSRPTAYPQDELFDKDFGYQDWRYIGFKAGDLASIVLETGFSDPDTRENFGFTVGVHKSGPFEKLGKGWTNAGRLTPEQELALLARLKRVQVGLPGLLSDVDDVYEDFYWHRYLDPSFNLIDSDGKAFNNDASLKLYSAVRDPNDRTIDNIADFMIRLGKEVASVI